MCKNFPVIKKIYLHLKFFDLGYLQQEQKF